MNFFVNATMPKQKSGIEHAQLKRLALFNEHQTEARLVLCDWDPVSHENLAAAGVDDAQVISMFDYFQQAQHVATTPVYAKDIELGVLNTHLVDDAAQQRYLVMASNNQLVARINYYADMAKRVKSVELFDGFNNLYRVDHYDSRGFVSLVQWYTPDNHIGTEAWLTPTGETVLEAFYRLTPQGERIKSGWRLAESHGSVHQFDTLTELQHYFFNQLNNEFWDVHQPNVFIIDRAHLGDWGLKQLERPAYVALHLHNAHTMDAQQPMTAGFNNHYEYALHNINAYDAIIGATQKQMTDVQDRLQPTVPLFTIPVGVVPTRLLDAPRVPVVARTFGKMVVFARIAWEKHLDDLVRAIAIVHEQIPAVTLDLYGYPDPTENYKAQRDVQALIEAHHLEQVVTFKGYTTDLDAVENDAMMYGLTSRMEGFNLAIMEAISHGLIGFTYDVNYGPNEIIQDGINGAVVPYGDYEALAAAIIAMLQDPALAQQYSTNAYESAQRYAPDTVWAAWSALLADAQTTWSQQASLPADNHE